MAWTEADPRVSGTCPREAARTPLPCPGMRSPSTFGGYCVSSSPGVVAVGGAGGHGAWPWAVLADVGRGPWAELADVGRGPCGGGSAYAVAGPLARPEVPRATSCLFLPNFLFFG